MNERRWNGRWSSCAWAAAAADWQFGTGRRGRAAGRDVAEKMVEEDQEGGARRAEIERWAWLRRQPFAPTFGGDARARQP